MTLPATMSKAIAGLKETSTRIAADSDDAQYLKLDKGGYWCFGAEETEVEEGSVWAINPMSLAVGYVAWGDGELLGEEMVPASDTPIMRADLPDVGAPWKPQIGLQLVCTNGEDKDVVVIYKASSKGGQKAFKQILDAIVKQAESGTDKVVPLVTLEVDSYKHSQYGKIYTPILEVVEWADMDGMSAEPEAAEAEEPETEAEQPEDDKPKRRRRRRS